MSSQNNLFPIVYLDPPEVFNCTVTPIPGSGSYPLEVIENTGKKAAHAINYQDTTGEYIGVYTGAQGEEVLRCIIGGGAITQMPVVIGANNRVSLRSMSASTITNGKLSIILMGFGL